MINKKCIEMSVGFSFDLRVSTVYSPSKDVGSIFRLKIGFFVGSILGKFFSLDSKIDFKVMMMYC